MRLSLPLLIGALSIGCAGLPGPRADRRLDEQPLVDVRRSRVGGETPQLPDAVRRSHPGQIVSGAYRVCLDVRSGRVEKVRPLRGIAGADDAIMAALRTGRWLIEVPPGGAPASLCFAEGLEFSVEGQSRVVSGPYAEAEVRRSRIGGATPHLPPLVRLRHRGDVVRGTYRVCVDAESGRISELRPLEGIEGADDRIAFAMNTWSWLFQVPAPLRGSLCFQEELRFTVPDGAARAELAQADYTPSAPIEFKARPGDAPPRSFVFRRSLVRGAWPSLPEALRERFAGFTLIGVYKLCADGRTGRVSAVRPVVGIPEADLAITEALSGWRYEVTWPDLLQEICFVEQLRFALERRELTDAQVRIVSSL